MKNTSFQTSEAGRKFIELYAEPVVVNSYLKITLLIVALIALVLLALLYRVQTAASRLKPLVISVSDIGRGQVMNYDDFSQSLDFLSDQLQAAALQQVHQQKALQTFLLDPSAPDVDIRIDAVNLIDLRKPPYSAQIEFEKVFRAPGDSTVLRRERWTANVVYSFRKEVPNSMLLTNPLGLVIRYVQADQAFGG